MDVLIALFKIFQQKSTVTPSLVFLPVVEELASPTEMEPGSSPIT